MRSQDEIVERFLEINSLVGFKSESSAVDEETDITINAGELIDKLRRASWRDAHMRWKATTPPNQQYDTGVMMGKLQILEWVLGGEEE